MSSGTVPHWADMLSLRAEVTQSDGSVGELQMSLHKAVYRTVDVPYRKVDYYVDITQPTPNMVGFFARLARRLGTYADAPALFHLDQGMGGGKSHALVGLYHMASSSAEFFDTELGQLVRAEAEQGGLDVDLSGTQTVVLTADYFSPGKTNEVFGPATSLFERFIWSLVGGDMDRYQHYIASGPNKATLQRALADAHRPVLILLDELMDYVLQLSDVTNVDRMPNEMAFLNALMDACDDVPRVAFVLVMIRSDLDERGYPPLGDDFRAYIAERIVRNGTTVAVTEAQDFAAIIQRRLFENARKPLATGELAGEYMMAADANWRDQVFEKLGPNRTLTRFGERVEASYPFHPELMRLVQQEWSQVQNFQRVRSTVAIFARTVLYWVTEHAAGRWAPALIDVGDIPLTFALEQVLSSGLLMNNDRAIQGYRSVATTDVTSSDGTGGRAVSIDARLRQSGVTARQAAAAVRMATALFCYSLVTRPRAGRGATKAELLAAIFEPDPGTPYTEAEEVFNSLTGDDGLGSLEITTPPNAPARYYLSIKQTLRMYFTASLSLINSEARDQLLWETAQRLARRGLFDDVRPIDAPSATGAIDMERAFEGVDSTDNRLVVLDPRRWALLNGKDALSREEITGLLGLGPQAMRVENAASCVVACVNAQRRDVARKRAGEALAWRHVVRQINPDEVDELREANAKLEEATAKLNRDVEKAFQHYVYLVRAGELVPEFKRFDDDTKSSLRGEHVWAGLVEVGRASIPTGLSADYLAALLDTFDRALTPREIVQSFYKNPSFPLVPSTDDIRRAIYDLLHEGWELVDADGNPLAIASPGQISINSIQQTLRGRVGAPTPGPAGTPGSATAGTLFVVDGQFVADVNARDDPYRADRTTSTTASSTAVAATATTYKRYVIELSNRSITSPETREKVWQLLKELAKVIDNANAAADHQLLSLSLTLTTSEGHQGHLEERARQAGARVRIEDDEF
jgi:Protein of unknown function (DUF499)